MNIVYVIDIRHCNCGQTFDFQDRLLVFDKKEHAEECLDHILTQLVAMYDCDKDVFPIQIKEQELYTKPVFLNFG